MAEADPHALGVAVAGLRGAPAPGGDERRTPARALATGAVIWVGWLVVTGLVRAFLEFAIAVIETNAARKEKESTES